MGNVVNMRIGRTVVASLISSRTERLGSSMPRNRLIVPLGVCLAALGCAKVNADFTAPTICDLTLSADAIVEGSVTSLGAQESSGQAGLSPVDSQTEEIQAGWLMVPVTISVSSTLKGAAVSTVSAFAPAGEMGPGAAAQEEGLSYPDGSLASGYFFLRKNNAAWVVENSGFLRRVKGSPGTLQNIGWYVSGISEPSLQEQVSSAAASNQQPGGRCPAFDGGISGGGATGGGTTGGGGADAGI